MRLVARAAAAKEQAWHRHHIDRRRMMLGDVIAVEAQRLGLDDIVDALIKLLRQRPVSPVDVIENPELHYSP